MLARVKVAYASLYGAQEGLRLTRGLAGTTTTIAQLAQSRYAQGLGSQADIIAGRVEQVQVETEIARLEADRQQAEARLNALLGRPAGTLFAAHRGFRPLPPEEAVRLPQLLDRALRSSPVLAAEQERIAAAQGGRDLAARSWYPDVTLGLSIVEDGGEFAGYEAMVELALPLRWGVRRARQREAAARVAAAQAARRAAARRIEEELATAVSGLEVAHRVAAVLHGQHLPQARLALEAALKAIELDQAALAGVLDAERRLRGAELEHLTVQVEQQERLAEVEWLLGSEL